MMMQHLFLPLLVLAGFAAAVPLVDKLARKLALGLNAEWGASALAWAEAAGADEPQLAALENLSAVEVPDPRPLVVWFLGLLVATLSAVWVWQHPLDLIGISLTVALGLGLLVTILVDIRIQILPDSAFWPLTALGIVACLTGFAPTPQTALIGALAGGGALWLLATGFRLLRNQEGLGMGDVKLVAIAGLWLGWVPLPWLLFAASVFAIVLYLVMYRTDTGRRIAFGPALACAFLAVRLVVG